MRPNDNERKDQDVSIKKDREQSGTVPSSSEAAVSLGKVIAALYRSYTLYPANHPAIRKNTEKMLELLDLFFQESDQVTVGFLGNDLIVLSKNLYRSEGSIQGLNSLFHEVGIEKIRFFSGITGEEISPFFSALITNKETGDQDKKSFPLKDEKWPHIIVGRFRVYDGPVDSLKDGTLDLNLNEALVVKEFIESCEGLVSQIRENKLIDFNLASEVIEDILSGIIMEDQAIPIVARIKEYDEYTYTHILNVSTLSLAMGRVLGFTQQQLRDLGLAALLHDTGKLMVPQEILQKSGKLNKEEYNIVQKHPVHGASMLMQIKDIPEMVPIVAFEHHMQVGGGGYPRVHSKRKPHLCSRITAIADIFDALRTNRAYREEFSKEETLKKMSAMRLDPFLFNLFARISNLYSVGDHVRLCNNQIGVVHEVNPRNVFRPKVKILYDLDDNQVRGEQIVNLEIFDKQNNKFLYSIDSIIPEDETKKLA